MADFKPAYEKTSIWEGGYVNDIRDTGGETYCGISRNNFPDWLGWAEIDRIKRTRAVSKNEKFKELEALVEMFYKSFFWNKIRGDEIAGQKVAESVFDFSVNSGLGQSALITQRILRDRLKRFDVTLDGKWGPNTVKALNEEIHKLGEEKLNTLFNISRLKFYMKLAREQRYLPFLMGWLNRTESFC